MDYVMMEREEPLQLNEEWFLSLDNQARGKELVQIINMILRGQHHTNKTLENIAAALPRS